MCSDLKNDEPCASIVGLLIAPAVFNMLTTLVVCLTTVDLQNVSIENGLFFWSVQKEMYCSFKVNHWRRKTSASSNRWETKVTKVWEGLFLTQCCCCCCFSSWAVTKEGVTHILTERGKRDGCVCVWWKRDGPCKKVVRWWQNPKKNLAYKLSSFCRIEDNFAGYCHWYLLNLFLSF